VIKSDREVPIYDVSKAVNIVPPTVSRSLRNNFNIREETMEKVKATAGETG
jgi:DNA-binding LacI/PurR family transcriptional regulator